MGNKLYVGNLPYSATQESLQKAFSEHGSVSSATVVIDTLNGQSKGFGFVEMATDAEAQKAIQALNGTDMDGRNIKVNEAKPQASREGGVRRLGKRNNRH